MRRAQHVLRVHFVWRACRVRWVGQPETCEAGVDVFVDDFFVEQMLMTVADTNPYGADANRYGADANAHGANADAYGADADA